MENLDKLTSTGLPVFDLNSENISRTDWPHTALGDRDSWPFALAVLVNTCILPFPHAAAIFWGQELAIVHNLAWGKASGNLDGQGACAADSYSREAMTALKASVRGRTVKVACKYFFSNTSDIGAESLILLSTVLDEKGSRQGVLAQLLHNSIVEKYLPLTGIDELVGRQADVRHLKSVGEQQSHSKSSTEQADSVQTHLFQRFAELLPNGTAILDSNAEAVFVNDNFFKLTTNKSSQEFRAWPESIHPFDYDRVMDAYREAFSSRRELRVEFRCTTESTGEEGDWRLFLLRPLSEHPEAGFICAVVDITEIKHAQLTQEKAATEAKERKDQQERFIDMVSHEIRNPLSAVLHLAEEIKEVAKGLTVSPDQRDQIADIFDAADTILLCVSHQNTLVDDILSFSKLDSMMLSLVPRELRPKWEFSKSLKVFNSEFKAKNIKFHYAMDVSYDEYKVDYVIADLNRMKQVLVNLITNAIKFTAKKQGERKIEVSIGVSVQRPTSYPPNVVFFGQDEQSYLIDSTMTAEWGTGKTMYIMVAVKDSGIGISAENQVKLFERFRQATPKTQENYGGSGLGLFISRKLCQLHGGDIGVSSKEGLGSTFGFFFKVRQSDGMSEDGRPPFSSRTTSESSIHQRSHTPRPNYSRANSNLHNIKERLNEEVVKRPKPHTLTSHEGIDPDEVDNSLQNPPTEYRQDAHPSPNADERTRETEKVADQVSVKEASTLSTSQQRLTDLEQGETQRQADTAANISKSQSNDGAHTRPTLLLVEDNLINQKVLRRQLQSRGFEVFVASNGQDAVDAVEARGKSAHGNSDQRNYFDCILMDQEMPVKDGNAATQEIRELQEQGKAGRSPILGVSANVREAQTTSMLEAGMDAVISKPFKVDDLIKKIKTLLPNG